jgi:hypothetical protein
VIKVKKRIQITKLIKSVLATDFIIKKDAAYYFGITQGTLSIVIKGGIPCPEILAYIGYERHKIIRCTTTGKAVTKANALKSIINDAEKNFGSISDIATAFKCTETHWRAIKRGVHNPSKRMFAFSGFYITDEYKKVN